MQIRPAQDLDMRRLWDWWITGLSGLVPESDARREASRESSAEIFVRPDSIELYRRQRLDRPIDTRCRVAGVLQAEIGNLPLKARESVTVTFELSKCHRRQLVLPYASRARVDEILRLRTADLNPFPAVEPMHFFRTDGGGDHIQIDHAILRQDIVSDLANSLKQLNVRVAAFGVRENGDAAWPVLRQADGGFYRATREAKWRRRCAISATALIAALFLAAMMGWRWQADAVAEAQTATQELQPAAVKVRKALEVIGLNSEQLRAAAFLKSEAVNIPDLLEQLTNILPDHTWVQNISVHGKSIQIDGTSGDAEALIQTLENSPYFSNVRFSAPVFKGPVEDRVHYSISAEVQRGSG